MIKSKTAKQYEEMIKNISTLNYTITVNKINNIKGNVVYIKGEAKINEITKNILAV